MRDAELPVFSVVIPSYQQGRYIADALKSVIQQECHFEILVLDAGSKDNSVSVIRQYENQIAWWRSKPDGGQAQAVNEGVQRAKGDLICWLNSDDLLVAGALRKVEDAFKADRNLEMLVGSAFWCNEDASEFSFWSAPRRLIPSDLSKAYSFLAQPSVFIKHSVWEKLGYLDESLHFSLDYDFWIRCLKAGVYAKTINDPLSINRIQPSAKSRDSKMFDEIFERSKFHFQRTTLKRPTGYLDAFGLDLFQILPLSFILSTFIRKVFDKRSILPGGYVPWRYRSLAVPPQEKIK